MRNKTQQVRVGNILIGGDAPVIIQSMTNSDTANIPATIKQIKELADAGSEIVRITVNNDESAAAVGQIRKALDDAGYSVPLVGDFHYIGHTLLEKYPDCAKSLAKYRINPGNVGFGKKRDNQFAKMIQMAVKYNKPVRIGVNWGSLDQTLLAKMLDENAELTNPIELEEVQKNALIKSALDSAKQAQELGLTKDKIIISCKVSNVNQLIDIYRKLSEKSDYALHLGLTEAGMGVKGIVSSTAALSILLNENIGDTIRVSITPEPNSSRTKEVIVAQEIVQSLGLRSFNPQVISCPGCGRTTSSVFQELAQDIEQFLRDSMLIWKEQYTGVEEMKLAVMGCIVNGPGESKHANIGISLPGTGESLAAPVFIDGKKATTLRGQNIAEEFRIIITDYVQSKYG